MDVIIYMCAVSLSGVHSLITRRKPLHCGCKTDRIKRVYVIITLNF